MKGQRPVNGPLQREGLTPAQYEFCLHYLKNGFNATAAYKAAYPEATPRSARELGHRLLTKVDIKTFLATQLAEVWKALHMDGDEALARVAMDARADIRLLFNEKGDLLNPQDWPDEVARLRAGCERPFTPSRANQRHCNRSARQSARHDRATTRRDARGEQRRGRAACRGDRGRWRQAEDCREDRKGATEGIAVSR